MTLFSRPALRKLPIVYHLIWWLSLLLVLTLAIAGTLIYSSVHETVDREIKEQLTASTETVRQMVRLAADVSIRNHLQAIAEKNLEILNDLDRRVRQGELTEAGARALAERILLSQKIGRTGYIYALSGKGILEVHPNTGMKRQDVSSHWLCRRQQAIKTGYLEYAWKNPGEANERAKAMFMVYFQPWDWILSVSSYRDEFGLLFDVGDIKGGLDSIHSAADGYTCLVSGSGKILVHPWLAGRVDDPANSGSRPLLQQLLRQKSGQLVYRSQDPGENRPTAKMATFEYLEELDWLVVSSAQLDQLYHPLDRLRSIILSILLLLLLLIFPLAYFLGRSITRPITRLIDRMSSADAGDCSVRADENALGEVGVLAGHFNRYMERLKASTENLAGEITERVRVEQQLKLFAKVFENALEGISITDAKGNIVAVNRAFTRITGYTEQQVLNQNPRILKSERHGPDFYQQMWQSLVQRGTWTGEIWNRRADGEAYPEILSISSIRDSNEELTHYVAVFHDITDLKIKEEQIKYQAYHDALTCLPNRYLAKDRLTMAMTNARRKRSRVAVFYIDLDNFKHVNDSLGHPMGDLLLQQVGERLVHLVREEDTVARLGGDEFQIIAVDITTDDEVIDLAGRLLQGFTSPFRLGAHELHVTLSIGIAIHPQDGADADTLIKNADAALYQTKQQGKNNFSIFTSDLSEKALCRLQLEADLRLALAERQFVVHFQPKMVATTGRVVGVEALVRWQQPGGAVVSPDAFISLAEETGLIAKLGDQVLEEACKAMRWLQGMADDDFRMAVNLSPFQFAQAKLVENLVTVIQDHGLSPALFELEITESTMMANTRDTIAKLRLLAEAGLSVAIDDFGTGYSSLYYLKAFPIDSLKIDRTFIRDIVADPNGARIVETIVLMAHNLGIRVVAEGVETQEQAELLIGYGCDLIQGHHCSPPLALEALADFLKASVG